MDNEKISILAVVHKNLDNLIEYVNSVKAFTTRPYEIIFVNNNAGDDIKQYLESIQSKDIKVLNLSSNIGIGPGVNLAFSAAQTNHLFKTDTDIVIKSFGWEDAMIKIVEMNEGVGTVGSQACVLKRDEQNKMIMGYIQGCCQYIPRGTTIKIYNWIQKNREILLNYVNNLIINNENQYSGYLRDLAKNKQFIQCNRGFLDEGYFCVVDDQDYDLMVRVAGMECALANVSVFHKDAGLNEPQRGVHVSDGFQYFRTKWDIIKNVCGDEKGIIGSVLSACFGDYK